MNTPPTVAILAGGKSRRMGRDKSALPFVQRDQQTWLERLCYLAVTAGANVIVVGRKAPKDWGNPSINFFPDDTPSFGPIGGLATALHHAPTPVALVGCDMPRLTEQAFRWLVAQRVHLANSDGVAVIAAGQIEPLFSLYSPSLLPIIKGQIGRGEYSLRGVIHSGRFAIVDAPDWLVPQLAGVNTPQELEAWRAEQS